MLTAPRTSLLCVTVAIVALSGCREPERAASVREDARPAFGGDFTLTSQDNQPFRLHDVRGRPVAAAATRLRRGAVDAHVEAAEAAAGG